MRFLALILMLLVCACATGPRFSYSAPTATSSNIYLYRTYKFAGSAASPNIYLDGQLQGKLHAGGYVLMPVTPGGHEVTIGRLGRDNPNWSPKNVVFQLQVAPESEYFLRMVVDLGGVSPIIVPVAPTPLIMTIGTAEIKILPQTKEIALPELEKTKISNPSTAEEEIESNQP